MNAIRCLSLVAVTLAAGRVAADAGPESATALQQRIAELEDKSNRDDARIAELESRLSSLEEQDTDWLTEQRAAEIRTIVGDVLADADTRTSHLWGIEAGFDDGVVISASGGDWRLQTNFVMQQRFVINHQSSGTNNNQYGFENPRTKFILTGNVVKPEWFYKIEIETATINTGLPNLETRTGLLDSYAGYDFGNGWKIGVGTFKTPLLREELVDSRYQLAVERSLVNYYFTGGRTDGIAVDYQGEQFHFTGSYNNGINDAFFGGGVRTGGTSALSPTKADFAFTFRGEWLVKGEWDQFTDFTSPPGQDPGMMVGGALHMQVPEDGLPDVDLFVLTLDFSGEFGGANAFGAIIFTSADPDDTAAFVAQGGYAIDEDWEAFARFEWSDMEGLSTTDLVVLTAGFNYYFGGHNAKWTTDIGVGIERVQFGVPITDYRDDPAGTDGQVVIRSQLQLAF